MTEAATRRATVLRPSALRVHQRPGGVRTIPLVNALIGSESTLSGITEFDSLSAVPLHFHNCEETVLLLEGDAIATIDGVDHRLQAGDVTWIPAGVRHRFRNVSPSDRMRIYWTYASIDANRTNVETGVVTRIDEEHGVARPR